MIYNFGGVAPSLILLLAYHGYLRSRLRDDPNYTVHKVNVQPRTR